jgi:hypothetical protein
VQLTLVISPDPSVFGTSPKLLSLSALFYLFGGLLSSLTLLLALSTHWSLKDLHYRQQAQVEGERLRRLGLAER